MNREIKFRGKSSLCNTWLYGLLIRVGCQYYISDENDFDTDGHHIIQVQDMPLDIEAETIGQFTGKCDKNKKEIYSGDLLKDQDGVIYEIWYSEDTAAFMAEMINPANDMVDILGGYDTERCFEVIGNIHDNPDLLEE